MNNSEKRLIEKNWYNIGIIIIIAFLLVFAAFSPVEEKMAEAAKAAAFAIGIIDIAGEAVISGLKGHRLYNKFAIVLSAGIFFALNDRVGAGIILLVYLICRIGIRFLDEREKNFYKVIDTVLPEQAKVYVNGVETLMDAAGIKAGNIVKVCEGDIIPGDGIIFEGKAIVDEAPFPVGEDRRKAVKKGDRVLAGSRVCDGKMQIEMTAAYDESYMAENVKAARKVIEEESDTGKKYSKSAKIYLVIMWLAAISLIAVGIVTENTGIMLMQSGILILSTTIGGIRSIWKVATGHYITDAFKEEVVFSEKKTIDFLERTDLVLIDEVITKGTKEYSLSHINNIEGTKEEIMTYAGYMEYNSKSPVGQVIYNGFLQVAEYEGLKEDEALMPELIKDFNELEGKGVSGYLDDMFICVGNEKMMQLINLRDLPTEEGKEVIYVAVNQKLLGYISINVEYRNADTDFYEEWGSVNIDKIATFDNDYQQVLEDMIQEKKNKSVIGVITKDPDKIKNLTGADYTVLLGARGKNNTEGDLKIPGEKLKELAELKTDLHNAITMTKLKCRGYIVIKLAFYGAAFFGVLPVWIPFVTVMCSNLLLNMSGENKNASTNA